MEIETRKIAAFAVTEVAYAGLSRLEPRLNWVVQLLAKVKPEWNPYLIPQGSKRELGIWGTAILSGLPVAVVVAYLATRR